MIAKIEFQRRGPDRLFLASADRPDSEDSGTQPTVRRILVVDDDIDGARSLSYLLADMGYRVEYAINGIAGLKIAQDFRPHVVILDLKLPDIHGAEMARQLRRDPVLRGARIVAITGSTQKQDAERALAGGCDEVLVKPIRVAILDHLIAGAKPGE